MVSSPMADILNTGYCTYKSDMSYITGIFHILHAGPPQKP